MTLHLRKLPAGLSPTTSSPAPARKRRGGTATEPTTPRELLTHMLYLSGWHPVTINQLLAKGRWAWTLKKKDRERIAEHVALVGIPAATGKRRVTLTITLGPRQRAADPDAYFKGLLDSLVACGALLDDNRQNVELAPVRFQRGAEKATSIVLEDIE